MMSSVVNKDIIYQGSRVVANSCWEVYSTYHIIGAQHVI